MTDYLLHIIEQGWIVYLGILQFVSSAMLNASKYCDIPYVHYYLGTMLYSEVVTGLP